MSKCSFLGLIIFGFLVFCLCCYKGHNLFLNLLIINTDDFCLALIF
jgi:hypothetical protein